MMPLVGGSGPVGHGTAVNTAKQVAKQTHNSPAAAQRYMEGCMHIRARAHTHTPPPPECLETTCASTPRLTHTQKIHARALRLLGQLMFFKLPPSLLVQLRNSAADID